MNQTTKPRARLGPLGAVAVWCLAALAALAALGKPPLEVQSLPIVSAAIAYHGGDLYRASTTELDLCSKSGCFHISATVDGDRFDLSARRDDEGRSRRVRVTNDTVEQWVDGQSVSVAPGETQRLRDWVMQRVYFAFLPFRLDDPSVRKQDLGFEIWGNRRLQKVKITFAAGSSTDADDEYLFWFEPESGRVAQFAYSFQGSPGGLRFRKAINSRRIGGILFFDQENYGVEGEGLRVDQMTPAFVKTLRRVSTVRLENIEVRPLVP